MRCPLAWPIVSLLLAAHAASQPQPPGEPRATPGLDQRVFLSVEFEPRGYSHREPIVGWTVLWNRSNDPITIFDPVRFCYEPQRRSNLELAIRDRRTSRPVRIVELGSRGPESYIPPVSRVIRPGGYYCSAFVLDRWADITGFGVFDVDARLTLTCDKRSVVLTGSGSFDRRFGSVADVDRVVTRLAKELRAGRTGHEPPWEKGIADSPFCPEMLLQRLAMIETHSAATALAKIALRSSMVWQRMSATHALARQNSPVALETLVVIMDDPERRDVERSGAADALAHSIAPGAKRALATAYDSPVERVRYRVAKGMAHSSEPFADRVLESMRADPSRPVREVVNEALRRRGRRSLR